jgi:hypothetical protein
MTGGAWALVTATFLASAVEAVESLTIVLAVGVTRGWRFTLAGVGAAIGLLGLLILLIGPRLVSIPIDTLRLVVGALLLVFGLQWLRKAIQPSRQQAGRTRTMRSPPSRRRPRLRGPPLRRTLVRSTAAWLTLAFKGVFLEVLRWRSSS